MKKILKFFVFIFSCYLYSQSFEVVNTLKFGDPFDFNPNWDRIEGYPLGPVYMYFNNDGLQVFGSKSPQVLYNLSLNSNGVKSSISISDGAFIIAPKNQLCIGEYGSRFVITYNEKSREIESDIGNYSFDSVSPFMTDNFLFIQTISKELISWELLDNTKYIFRNIEETKELLNSDIAEELGYHNGPLPVPFNFFGDYYMGNMGLHLFYIGRDLEFPEAEEAPEDLEGFEFIGLDSKGLSYYWGLGPKPVNQKRLQDAGYDFQVMLVVIDTWTKKVTYRLMDKGTWTPPKDENNNLIGAFPKAIHPNGDLFVFDADPLKMEYQLKRLKNDWWDELGVTNRYIGRITHNHIPLQVSDSTISKNNGYNYDNEYVWILEEGASAVNGKGQNTKWVKIRKIDGREGWIYLSNIYFE